LRVSFMQSSDADRTTIDRSTTPPIELLSNLVFEDFWSCGDLAVFSGFNSVFERDACDDFGQVIKAA